VALSRVALIPGDGIGPEVLGVAERVLEWFQKERGLAIELVRFDLGAERYLRTGEGLPPAVRDEIQRSCRAVLLGAIGDPRVPGSEHAKEIVLGLRQHFDLFANVRPVRALADRLVPLKGRSAADVDFIVVRENTEGAYVGAGGQLRRGTVHEVAIDEDLNTRFGVERVVRAAFEIARHDGRTRVHLADKSNALRNGQELWRRTFYEVAAEYRGIEAIAEYVDALCYRMIADPGRYQVIVTNNLFGDIVSDLAAALQGGLGMAPSANLHFGVPGRLALFEPVHGSAPELAGLDRANPFGALLSTALLLRELGHTGAGSELEGAVASLLEAGRCTADVGGTLGARATGEAVLAALAERRS
jgi:3-isopropylmalate dehydrogenase